MKVVSLVFFICLALVLPFSGFASDVKQTPPEVSIITGVEAGTYYAFGKDMKKILTQKGMQACIIPSMGSAENIFKVTQFPSIQMAMTQRDALSLLAIKALFGKDDSAREAEKILEQLRIVLPLYREEVHVIAGGEIKGINDLNGKKIAIGDVTSGTLITSLIVIDAFQIRPAEADTFGWEEAVEALKKGQIDAFFTVVGAPADILKTKISKDDKFRILPLRFSEAKSPELLKKLYSGSVIKKGTYSWQAEDVDTIAVDTVLIMSEKGVSGSACENIGTFAKTVIDNLKWLQTNGHPKWKSISFSADELIKDELVTPCVRRMLKK